MKQLLSLYFVILCITISACGGGKLLNSSGAPGSGGMPARQASNDFETIIGGPVVPDPAPPSVPADATTGQLAANGCLPGARAADIANLLAALQAQQTTLAAIQTGGTLNQKVAATYISVGLQPDINLERLLVTLGPGWAGGPQAVLTGEVATLGGSFGRSFEIETSKFYVLQLPGRNSRALLAAAAEQLYAALGTGIALIQPSFSGGPAPASIPANYPNDVLMNYPASPTTASRNWAPLKVSAAIAWQMSQGVEVLSPNATVLVANLDTGIYMDHEDLAGRILDLPSPYVDNPTAPPGTPAEFDPSEVYDSDQPVSMGHGTLCGGLIVASANNSNGGCGIAPQAKIVPFKVYHKVWDPDRARHALTWDIEDVIAACNTIYAARTSGDPAVSNIRVVNWELQQGAGAVENSELALAAKRLFDKGILITCANGNYYDEPNYSFNPDDQFPHGYQYVYGVGPLDINDRLAPDYGHITHYTDFMVPAQVLYSTYLNNSSSYESVNGSSAATAIAAGCAALAMATNTSSINPMTGMMPFVMGFKLYFASRSTFPVPVSQSDVAPHATSPEVDKLIPILDLAALNPQEMAFDDAYQTDPAVADVFAVVQDSGNVLSLNKSATWAGRYDKTYQLFDTTTRLWQSGLIPGAPGMADYPVIGVRAFNATQLDALTEGQGVERFGTTQTPIYRTVWTSGSGWSTPVQVFTIVTPNVVPGFTGNKIPDFATLDMADPTPDIVYAVNAVNGTLISTDPGFGAPVPPAGHKVRQVELSPSGPQNNVMVLTATEPDVSGNRDVAVYRYAGGASWISRFPGTGQTGTLPKDALAELGTVGQGTGWVVYHPAFGGAATIWCEHWSNLNQSLPLTYNISALVGPFTPLKRIWLAGDSGVPLGKPYILFHQDALASSMNQEKQYFTRLCGLRGGWTNLSGSLAYETETVYENPYVPGIVYARDELCSFQVHPWGGSQLAVLPRRTDYVHQVIARDLQEKWIEHNNND